MILREDLHYVIIRDKLLLVELSEDPFNKGFFDSFKVFVRNPCVSPTNTGPRSWRVALPRNRCSTTSKDFHD
jgi:hypothetical protein